MRCRSRRSEEHTSELQSQSNLVCRLLLEKKTHATSKTRATDCATTADTAHAPSASAYPTVTAPVPAANTRRDQTIAPTIRDHSSALRDEAIVRLATGH